VTDETYDQMYVDQQDEAAQGDKTPDYLNYHRDASAPDPKNAHVHNDYAADHKTQA